LTDLPDLKTRADSAEQDRLAIYIHWPFCERKCPYCDFNSHVRDEVDHPRWQRALLAELAWFAERTQGYRVPSIFFGGGTPSLMKPSLVAALIDAVAGHWPLDAQPEITLEANPSSVEAGRFADYRHAGVNRVSLGVQALDDQALAFLGRLHSKDEALAALDVARHHFDRISFDLIYARPEQSLKSWRDELSRALRYQAGHLSAYQLTIEQDTAFFRRHARGDFHLPDEDLAADLFELTAELTAQAGLYAYETSNYARPGEESRHNLIYWQGGGYLGIGPGAHGRMPTAPKGPLPRYQATSQIKRPEDWLLAVENHGHGRFESEEIDPESRAAEAVMMGLRLTKGIDRHHFKQHTGCDLMTIVNRKALAELVEQGLLECDAQALRTSQKGRLLLNAIIGRLLG
jgi:oxygen-independent coproporphyrinogen-3 oxidase